MAASEPGVWSTSVPNRSPTLVIISVVFLIITTAFFSFRQGWRWVHRQRGVDDAVAACAYITLVIQSMLGGVAAHYGFGKHRQAILPTLPKALEYFYLYQICYKLLGGFTKLTFCFLYLRIFSQKRFNKLVIVVSFIVAAGSIAFALGTIFQCVPVHRAWDRKIPGHCISNTAFWYSHAAFNVLFDIVVYVMPMPMIRTLKLAHGQKTGLISIFCLGAFVIAAAVVRMVMLRSSADSTDPTWGSVKALYWTEIEANTSVICCCLPALRVPFLNLCRRIREGKPSTPRRFDEAARKPYDGAWSGPQQSQPVVSHLPVRPQNAYRCDTYRSNVSGSNGESMQSSTGADDNWYDRVLHMNREKDYDASRSTSQDELSRVEHGLPEGLPAELKLGAIYKTTDLHVSTQQLRRESGPDAQRQMSLRDMLNEK